MYLDDLLLKKFEARAWEWLMTFVIAAAASFDLPLRVKCENNFKNWENNFTREIIPAQVRSPDGKTKNSQLFNKSHETSIVKLE